MQKYHIYCNACTFIFTNGTIDTFNKTFISFNDIIDFETCISKIDTFISNEFYIQITSKSDFITFLKKFTYLKAAGGLVLNENLDILMIYRNNMWDMPKGKMEKNESWKTTAYREVKEECGLHNLKLNDLLCATYHIYYHKQIWFLKKTKWYHMTSSIHETLIPQIEEGITDIKWINKNNIPNTFPLIHAVINLHLSQEV